MGISGKRTPAGEVELMIQLRRLGWSVNEVARELDCDRRTILRRASAVVIAARIESERQAAEKAAEEKSKNAR